MSPRRWFSLAALLMAASLGPITSQAAVPEELAQQIFREAEAICAADRGRLWGRTLCGPIVLVDPADRGAAANQADPDGHFRATGRVYVGRLPDEVVLSNTAVTWSGQRWTELIWPPPSDPAARRVLLAHEMFHRIQSDLGLSRPEPGNTHLDGLEGRALLQLEWRALDAALAANAPGEWRRAAADAIAFRRARYRLHSEAAAQEHALELNEGIPTYTGVRLGLADEAGRIAFARREIKTIAAMPNYVRTFAYATGPAYGLLLDRAAPRWRQTAATSGRFDEQLQVALGIADESLAMTDARAAAYGGAGIYAAERARDARRQAQLASFKAQLVDGPRLLLPTRGANRQFNPQNVMALAPFGMVYPTLRLSGPWGVLEVEHGGALLSRETATAAVPLAGATPDGLRGSGWRLPLQPGWRLAPGERPGDLVLQPAAP